ncbi:MAG: polyribonucleotide nucleotidyltransferase [Anaerolineae bacterium]
MTFQTSAPGSAVAAPSLELVERSYTATVGDKEFTLRTGKLAHLAGGAVTVQLGETLVLATATASKTPREGIDFFPLSVDLEERLYAAGRIPGSFFRREGRPSESAILTDRLIDRPLRPLFPKSFRNEVQIIITALSSDGQNYLDIPALIGASAAPMVSDIPFPEPVGAVRVGMVDGEFVIDPTADEMVGSVLDLRLAGTKDAILMVEAGAHELDEETIIRAIRTGHAAMQPIIEVQNRMRADVGKSKRELTQDELPQELVDGVEREYGQRIDDVLAQSLDKTARNEAIDEIRDECMAAYADDEDVDPRHVAGAFNQMLKEHVRDRILDEGIRPDGRGPDEIRPLRSEVGVSPRAHGSGLFQRGETQVLSITTLGTLGEEQRLDTLRPEETKRFLHHYNFPPYSTGETWFLRGPKRREIGHGALAETAIRPLIPSEDEFPYTVRIVSEVLASNGSSSMASVCASTLSLFDAGVPMSAPAAGIAMGLVTDHDDPSRYVVLTDIQGLEDALGDMDFKVAGTQSGITALQMDIKLGGLSDQILRESLAQARQARLAILDNMLATLPEPRDEISPYAPRILTLHIDPDSICKLIGPGGKTIRSLEEETGCKLDVQNDGTVYVAAVGGEGAEEAKEMILALTAGPELGKTYSGKVVRTTDFGAFVEILPGTDGLVHISQLSTDRVDNVGSVVQVGDEILVMVTDVTDGKVRLSRRAVLEGWTLEEARASDSGVGGRSRSGGRGGSRGGRRSGGGSGRSGR